MTYSEPLALSMPRLKFSTGPDALPKFTPRPQRAQAVERAHEGVLADAVIDDRHALAAGDLPDPGDEILALVVDDVIVAMRPGELGLLGRADGADHGRAQMLRPLADDQADAAGGRVEQDRCRPASRYRSGAGDTARSCP